MSVVAVLGGALGGFDELARLQDVAAVYAVNDAAAEYPGRLAAFVTLHPEKLPAWLDKRRSAGLPEPDAVVAHEMKPRVTEAVDYRWPGMTGSGSSGLFAVKVALEKTSLPIVLCGVPMTPAGTHYENSSFRSECHAFTDAWRIALPYLRERVRSSSGWTAELLGTYHPAGGTPAFTSERL